MRWYSEGIAEAIVYSKTQNATFVAYVEGQCDKSKLMSSVFNDKDVCKNLESGVFVCVKLKANSIEHRQFAEIYSNIPVPFLFFISHMGIPTDIVCGSLFDDAGELKETIIEASERCIHLNNTLCTSDVPKNYAERSRIIDEILQNRLRERGLSKTAQNPTPKPVLKPEKEKKKGKGGENGDAKQSKGIKNGDEKHKKTEDGPILGDIDEDEARQRVLDTIRKESSHARIQFRLPTGESKSGTFEIGNTLSQIRDYIDKNFQLPYNDYKLATTFPRREFTAEDSRSSLEELNLIPTAVLLILPASGQRVQPYSQSWFTFLRDMISGFFQPLHSMSNYIHGLIFRPSPGQDSTPPEAAAQSTFQQQGRQRKSRAAVRKVGNIYSLKDLRDGNDENNTWNGNSTQQMSKQ